jgi:hypothetical protein
MNRRDAMNAETGDCQAPEHLSLKVIRSGTSPSAAFSALLAPLRFTPSGR